MKVAILSAFLIGSCLATGKHEAKLSMLLKSPASGVSHTFYDYGVVKKSEDAGLDCVETCAKLGDYQNCTIPTLELKPPGFYIANLSNSKEFQHIVKGVYNAQENEDLCYCQRLNKDLPYIQPSAKLDDDLEGLYKIVEKYLSEWISAFQDDQLVKQLEKVIPQFQGKSTDAIKQNFQEYKQKLLASKTTETFIKWFTSFRTSHLFSLRTVKLSQNPDLKKHTIILPLQTAIDALLPLEKENTLLHFKIVELHLYFEGSRPQSNVHTCGPKPAEKWTDDYECDCDCDEDCESQGECDPEPEPACTMPATTVPASSAAASNTGSVNATSSAVISSQVFGTGAAAASVVALVAGIFA